MPNASVTRARDIWELGNHRLICRDSRDATTIGKVPAVLRCAPDVESDPFSALKPA
jgi:hypothetical protein